MCVRKNKNRTATTSVPIIDKAGGAYRVVRAIGSSRHSDEIKQRIQQAYDELHSVQHDKQFPLFASFTPRDTMVQNFLATLGNGSVCRERIAFAYPQRPLKSTSAVFYEMTTLYCEADNGDDLRKISFSKDGELQKPQIMLGALVGQYGYPIGHDIFEGNTFEVHTLLPILEQTQKKHGLPKPSVIADAALLSKENLKNPVREQYRFIIGARIKNESENIESKIL